VLTRQKPSEAEWTAGLKISLGSVWKCSRVERDSPAFSQRLAEFGQSLSRDPAAVLQFPIRITIPTFVADAVGRGQSYFSNYRCDGRLS